MKTTLSGAILALGGLTMAAFLPSTGSAQTIPIDRWLMSTPFPADTIEDPLARDHLAAGGEGFIFPDRGQEIGGTSWTLVRDDDATSFDGRRMSEAGRFVVYASAYLKSPSDQTVHLGWNVSACADVAVLFNGYRLLPDALPSAADAAEDSGMRVEAAWVRAGYGWNTIMVKVSSDCAATFGAWLDGSWPDEDVPPWPDGVRVQASRPPGDVRTGPEPWVVLSPAIGPLPFLEWTASHLAGYLRYRVAGWGAVSDSVRLRARTEGADDELVLRAGAPSAPTDTLVQVEFPRLRKAGMKAGTSRIELRWPDEKLEMELDVPAQNVLAAFHGPILMLGWGPGPDDPGPAPGDAAGLPLAGRILRGSWVVPDALDGFSLDLDVEQAPGSYRLELEDLETTGGSAVLCAPCSKGTRLDLFVTVAADWTEWPAALVTDPGYADTDADPASAAQWLSLLDDKGSKNYRERGLEASN